MMKHLKKFDHYSEYKAYLEAGDIYLPRVTLIVNGDDNPVTGHGIYWDDGQKWLDFSRIGGKFIEIANEGRMYITDQPDQGLRAEISNDGTIVLIDETTGDQSTLSVEEDGTIKVTWDTSKDRVYPPANTNG